MITTFQAIVYAVVHSLCEILPIGGKAGTLLVPEIFGWSAPPVELRAAIGLGICIAIFFFFIHDWASIISSFIQVILFRKKPMTLDERMPTFAILAAVPTVAAWFYLREPIETFFQDPVRVAISLLLFGLPLWFIDSYSKKNKGMFDWSYTDSFVVGLTQALMIIPGAGRTAVSLTGALARNYHREAALKFTFFTGFPVFIASTALLFQQAGIHVSSFQHPLSTEVSWITFAIAAIIGVFATFLALGALMKNSREKSLRSYLGYRVVLCAAFFIAYAIRRSS